MTENTLNGNANHMLVITAVATIAHYSEDAATSFAREAFDMAMSLPLGEILQHMPDLSQEDKEFVKMSGCFDETTVSEFAHSLSSLDEAKVFLHKVQYALLEMEVDDFLALRGGWGAFFDTLVKMPSCLKSIRTLRRRYNRAVEVRLEQVLVANAA